MRARSAIVGGRGSGKTVALLSVLHTHAVREGRTSLLVAVDADRARAAFLRAREFGLDRVVCVANTSDNLDRVRGLNNPMVGLDLDGLELDMVLAGHIAVVRRQDVGEWIADYETLTESLGSHADGQLEIRDRVSSEDVLAVARLANEERSR